MYDFCLFCALPFPFLGHRNLVLYAGESCNTAYAPTGQWRIRCFVVQLMQRAFTVCKLKEKGGGDTDIQACDEGETSNKRPTNLGNPVESPIQQVNYG